MNIAVAFEVCLKQGTFSKKEKREMLEVDQLEDIVSFYNLNIKNAHEDVQMLFNWMLGTFFNTCTNDLRIKQ